MAVDISCLRSCRATGAGTSGHPCLLVLDHRLRGDKRKVVAPMLSLQSRLRPDGARAKYRRPKQKPPAVSRRGLRPSSHRSSGIEIAMHAEAELPVVDVGDMRRPADGNGACAQIVDGRGTQQFRVHDIDTQVEVFRHVPLGARTEPPCAPIVVAPGNGKRSRARAPAVSGTAS
jgi:hypothetical protein